ncbi:hypothetical protein AUP68_16881 [Ilyonectria robusta]
MEVIDAVFFHFMYVPLVCGDIQVRVVPNTKGSETTYPFSGRTCCYCCKGEGIGNGRAAAILLAESGARVVCVDLSQTDAERTVQMIQNDGGDREAISIVADVAKEEECNRVVQETISKYRRLDILVNNVGIIGARGTAATVNMSH